MPADFVAIPDLPALSLPLPMITVLPLDDGSLTGRATLQNVADAINGQKDTVTALVNAAGVVTVDCSAGDYFTLTLSANVTSWVFNNLPGSGKGASKWIEIVQDPSTPRTVAWPASFKWQGGSAGSVSTATSSVDELAITTVNNGTAWKATLAKAFS